MSFDLSDYREVPERIAEWYARHPEGRIVCEIVPGIEGRVTVRASAYRTASPDEPPAGVGHSDLELPGRTPYTKSAELENAETSAAGRALVMAGIPAKQVASGNEIRSKNVGESTDGTREAPGTSLPPPEPTVPAGASGSAPSPTLLTTGGRTAGEDEEVTAPELLGEGASGPSFLTKDEQRSFAKAFGGQAHALAAARERFGDRVRSLGDITRDMALEMIGART